MYDKGISRCEDAIFISRASVMTTGISTMTTGVLFMNAEAMAAEAKNSPIVSLG